MALATMLCIYLGFTMIFRSMHDNSLFIAIVPLKLIQLMCYAFFVLLFISNSVAAIGNIYAAENMNLLLTTPVSSFRLYLAKIIEMVVETGFMLLIFALPAFLSFIYTLDVSWNFILAGALVALPFLIIPAGLSIAIATIFVRLSSVLWKRGALFLLMIAALIFWGLINLAHFLTHTQIANDSENAIIQLIGFFGNPNPIWLPSRWISDILGAKLGHPLYAGDLKAGLLVISALGSFTIGFLIFDFFHLGVRSQFGTHSKTKANIHRLSDITRKVLETIVSALHVDTQNKAIILKDLSSLLRDRAHSLQLILFLGVSSVYLIIFKYASTAIQLGLTAGLVWKAFLSVINIMFVGFIMTAMMTRLVYPAMSLEGRAFWILLTSPINLGKLIKAKYFCWLPIIGVFCLSLICASAIALELDLPEAICLSLTGISMSIGLTGLATGLGAVFASFEWESANQISAGLGTLVLLISSMMLVLFTLAPASVLTMVVIVPDLQIRLGGLNSFLAMSSTLFIILFSNLAIAKIACCRGTRALLARQM